MKNILTTFIFFATTFVFAQRYSAEDLRKATPEQRKEIINSLTPEQRKDLLKQYKENFLMEDLNIPDANKERFGNIYHKYQDEQRQIKDEFNSNFDPEKLSDSEAREKLEQSFITGQKLLDSRRKYADEMQQVLKPQQVLKMFRDEGKLRERFRDNQDQPGRFNNTGNARQNSGFRNPVRR